MSRGFFSVAGERRSLLHGFLKKTLRAAVLPSLGKDMLCFADRGFFGFALWKQAAATGADLLWRVKKNLPLP